MPQEIDEHLSDWTATDGAIEKFTIAPLYPPSGWEAGYQRGLADGREEMMETQESTDRVLGRVLFRVATLEGTLDHVRAEYQRLLEENRVLKAGSK